MPNACKNHEADEHPDGSHDKRPAATKVFDKVDASECDSEIDACVREITSILFRLGYTRTIENHLRNEWADGNTVEDQRAIVLPGA